MAERKREVWVCKFTAKSGRVFTELFEDEAKKDAYMQAVPSEGNPTAERYVPAEAGQSEAWVSVAAALESNELEQGAAYWVIWEGTLQHVPWVWYDGYSEGEPWQGWRVPGDDDLVSFQETGLCMRCSLPPPPKSSE